MEKGTNTEFSFKNLAEKVEEIKNEKNENKKQKEIMVCEILNDNEINNLNTNEKWFKQNINDIKNKKAIIDYKIEKNKKNIEKYRKKKNSKNDIEILFEKFNKYDDMYKNVSKKVNKKIYIGDLNQKTDNDKNVLINDGIVPKKISHKAYKQTINDLFTRLNCL